MAEVERRTGIKVDHADASNRTEPPGPRVSRHHGRTSLWLHGEQDIATVPLLAAALTAVVADHRGDVVVDLAMVDFIDASTVGVLVRGQRLLQFQSRNLRLRSPSRFARRVLELCGLTHLVEDGAFSQPESRGVVARCPQRGGVTLAPEPFRSCFGSPSGGPSSTSSFQTEHRHRFAPLGALEAHS